MAATPDFPEFVRQRHESGTWSVAVRVYVNALGSALHTRVIQSSGNAALDEAAREAAVKTKYSPRLEHCVAVPGTYTLKVTFSGGP